MDKPHQASRSFLFLLSSQLFSKIAGYLFFLLAARYLGVENFGIYTYALAVVTIFSVFIDYGFSTFSIREIAKDREKAHLFLSNTILLRTGMAVLAYGLILILTLLLERKPIKHEVLLVLNLYLFVRVFAESFDSLFFAFEKQAYKALLVVFNNLVILSFGYFLLKRGGGILTLSWVYVGGAALTGALRIFLVSNKIVKPRFSFSLEKCKWIVKRSTGFALPILVASLNVRVCILILSSLKGDLLVGLYNAASRLIDGLNFVPATLGFIIYPMFSRTHSTESGAFQRIMNRASKFILGLSLPIVIGVSILSRPIVATFYGQEYSSSALALSILACGLIPISLNYIFGHALFSSNLQRHSLQVSVIGLSLTIIGNMLLIGSYGLVGACIVTIGVDSFITLGYFYFLRKNGLEPKHLTWLRSLVFPAVLMAALVFFLKDRLFWIENLLIGTLAYVLISVISGAISKSEIREMLEIFGIKRNIQEIT